MPTICSSCGRTAFKCEGCTRPDFVPPSDCRRAKIREVLLANGFTIKEGHTDLKDYVYAAAEALLDSDLVPAKHAPPVGGYED